jgi:hypothetical protein
LAVICLVIGLSSVTVLRAQYGKKGTQSKGPRALGLLEMFPSGQTRLRPICIMIDGRFYDAGIYKADPVPMALETGTVYEAERNGQSQGLFTIKNVLQNEAKKTFVAEGTWLPAGAEAPKSTSLKAETKPKEEEDEKPPVLRRPGSEPPKQENPKPAENKPSSTSTQPDDDDRPRLHKPANETNPSATSSTATSSPVESSGQASSDADENDPNRPHLRRGVPSSSSKSAAAPAASEHPAGTKSPKAGDQKNSSVSTSAKNETQLLPAISDAGGPEPRPYTYDATPKEIEGFRNKVLALAGQDLVKQAKQLEPDLTATPAPRSVRTGKASTKPATVQPVWDDVDLKVFDVATSNEPILILSATGHLPGRAKPTNSESSSPTEFFVTEVAHSDLYGELRSLFSAVTDDRTLDVTPKYKLIDVVDADGDGRGELLFRRTSDQGNSFVVYRVGADRLWPLYEGTPQ